MNDREMLELAANAANLPHRWCKVQRGMYFLSMEKVKGEDWYPRAYWNPLIDDGDALRLAVKLNLRVQSNTRAAIATGSHGTTSEKILNGDPWAATRRAITRAAAEIGARITTEDGK